MTGGGRCIWKEAKEGVTSFMQSGEKPLSLSSAAEALLSEGLWRGCHAGWDLKGASLGQAGAQAAVTQSWDEGRDLRQSGERALRYSEAWASERGEGAGMGAGEAISACEG